MREYGYVHDLCEQLLLPVSGRGALMWLDVVIASAANEGGNKWLIEGEEIAGFAYTLTQAGRIS